MSQAVAIPVRVIKTITVEPWMTPGQTYELWWNPLINEWEVVPF